MDKLLAFLRKDALVAASYRTRTIMSIASLLTIVVPIYFIAGALQPIVGGSIVREGGQYFGFLIAGMATYQFVMAAVNSLPLAVANGLRTGTFEMLLTTPTRVPALLLGMTAYPLVWSAIRAVVMLAVGLALGANFAFDRILLVLVIWAAVSLAYIPFGVLSSALLLLTRTAGPLPAIVLTGSMLLGGVYYPTHVIPSWLHSVAGVVPLTYGLRAMRQVLSADVAFGQVAIDLGRLGVLALVLMLVSLMLFQAALTRARRAGTLAQY